MSELRDRKALEKGADLAQATLTCPVHRSVVRVADCTECAHCAALRTDSSERRSFVLCALDEHRGEVPLPGSSALSGSVIAQQAWAPITTISLGTSITTRPDMATVELAALLAARDLHGAAVVDAENRPIGVVTRADLHKGATADLPVSAVMTTTALCLHEGATIAQASAQMAFEGVFLLPVVSSTREVIGLVSSLDILRWIARESGYFLPE